MPKCELCGENEEKIIRCKECGSKFCEDCGSPVERLCINCLEMYFEEDSEEDYDAGYAEDELYKRVEYY